VRGVHNGPAPQRARELKSAKGLPMPDFIEPALATQNDTPPNGERWVHEIKLDGYRFQAHVHEGRVKFFTRRGHDFRSLFRRASAIAMMHSEPRQLMRIALGSGSIGSSSIRAEPDVSKVGQNRGMHMSDTANSFSLSTRRWLLGGLVSGLLALCFGGVAAAEEVKQIKLTEKHIQGFMAASKDMARLYDGADPDKPDPKVDAQAAAVAKKNGFASLAEYDGASMNISMIMFGIDPRTKKFTEPPDQIKKQIAALKIDKSVSEAEKKEELAELEAALKNAKPVQFKENVALVLKYFDKLAPLMPEQDSNLRPAD